MFGFKKKKGPEPEKAQEEELDETLEAMVEKVPKKGTRLKRLIMFVLIPSLVLAGAAFGYVYFFKKNQPDVRVYVSQPLAHVKLPDEMLKFTFDTMPDIYDSLVVYNEEVNYFDGEIQRIQSIGDQYPDQKKIADKEMRVWEKNRRNLVKVFSKLEKPIKESYVLYLVNTDQGMALVKEKKDELSTSAQAALDISRAQTQPIKDRAPKVPEGFVQGTIYKLKKKFL